MPLGKYSAICIIVWGGILSCFAAVTNYSGAIALRFFLGVFEAAVTPGFALLTSQVGISSLPGTYKRSNLCRGQLKS
jgi:ACS family allantoate permease-like MFS transporter